MSEDTWTDRLQAQDEERRGFNLEIKSKEGIKGEGEFCMAPKCQWDAITRYEIGDLREPFSTKIDLCQDHDSEESAWEEYRRII